MKRLSITLAAIAVTALMAAPAIASTGPAAYNSAREAGQYVQSNGTHYRYVHAEFSVSAALNDIGVAPENGGTGVQLCNNSTGYAIQFGIVPSGVPDVFNIEYQTGNLAQHNPASTHDACATGGILGGPTLFPGVSYQQVAVGDHVALSIYYHRSTGWVTLTVSDLNQGGTEEHSFHVGRWRNLTEPGAGVFDSAASGLSAPADIPLVTFTHVNATTTSVVRGSLNRSGRMSRADEYNTGGSAALAPSDLLQAGPIAGEAFTVWSGNPTT